MATERAIQYFKKLKSSEKKALAKEAGLSLGGLRNIFYNGRVPSMETTLRIEKASGRRITRYDIAPSIDWTLL
nr:MAG TPA: Putative antitoxin of bacterial toxin-antitoxin system, YdaS/YdaT [Caudoviricetes sp.]